MSRPTRSTDFTVDQEKKGELLMRLIKGENPRQSIIFCRTKRGTEKVQHNLQRKVTGLGLHSRRSYPRRSLIG